MKLKQFEALLQQVEGFVQPKIELEQYPTSAHLASRILFTADATYDDIEDKRVLDLGCGTAILSIGASVLGSGYTLGVDIDPDALAIATTNIDSFEADIELLQADIFQSFKGTYLPLCLLCPFGKYSKRELNLNFRHARKQF